MPNAGGIYDQEAGLLERMAWADSVYTAFRGRLTAKNVIQWIDSHEEDYELYAYVRGLLKDGN